MERWKFLHPFTARFVGPTACGKTTFLKQVIEQHLIEPWPSRIFYFYGSTWQSGTFDYLESVHGVHFVRGFEESIVSENPMQKPTLLICDDLVMEMRDSEVAANLFMRGSHHLNMSVIMIEQSLFPKGKQSVSMKQNTHYIVIFKSPADALGVATLARQIFPQQRGRLLVDAFHDCTKTPYSYLIVDAKQTTPDEVRLITNVTDRERHPLVYLSNHKHVNSAIKQFNQEQSDEAERGENGNPKRKQQQQQVKNCSGALQGTIRKRGQRSCTTAEPNEKRVADPKSILF